MKTPARLALPALVGLVLALPATAAEPAPAGPANIPPAATQKAADTALNAVQVRELLTQAGYTKIDDPEFEDGMWETDATSANGKRVDVRVDAGGRIFAEDLVSRLSAEDVKARLTAAGYSKIHDVKYDDGIWEAEGERADGQKVEFRVDPQDGRIISVQND